MQASVKMSVRASTAEGVTPVLISRFMGDIQEPRTSFISSDRFAARLGMNKKTLARIAGVHRNTLRSNPNSEILQARLREMISIIIAASGITGNIEDAEYWFKNEPISDYRGKTPADLVADGHYAAVISYIEDIKNGAAG